MFKFHKSGYWGNWSRVLKEGKNTVEVNLTPISGSSQDWEDSVRPIRIRVHSTARNYPRRGESPRPIHDLGVNELPADVRSSMIKHLGEELTTRLLEEDFLPQIDFVKYEKVCNGGASLESIRLD